MSIFGAAYAPPKKGATILYRFRSLSTELSPTEKVEFKDFSSDFPVLFKADLIFKNFSRKPLNSSTFQACSNPDYAYRAPFFTKHFS